MRAAPPYLRPRNALQTMRWIHFENPDDVYGWESDEPLASAGQVSGEWFGIEGDEADARLLEDQQTRFVAYLMAHGRWSQTPDVHEGTFSRRQWKELKRC